MRWTEQKSERFQVLRHAESHSALSIAERAELEALFADLDADESDARQPAFERMDAEAAAMAAEEATLDADAAELARIVNEEPLINPGVLLPMCPPDPLSLEAPNSELPGSPAPSRPLGHDQCSLPRTSSR